MFQKHAETGGGRNPFPIRNFSKEGADLANQNSTRAPRRTTTALRVNPEGMTGTTRNQRGSENRGRITGVNGGSPDFTAGRQI
jgi:hypothetical protein